MSIATAILRFFQLHGTPKPPEPTAPTFPPPQTYALSHNAMPLFFVEEWCKLEGYCNLQGINREWWAIPPGGVMPVPLCLCTQADWLVWVQRHKGIPVNPCRGEFWRNNLNQDVEGIAPGEYAVFNGSEWVNIRQYFEAREGVRW